MMIRQIHIPKTAGTSIKQAVGQLKPRHNKLFQLAGDSFFSCVRNPYDRACSAFWFVNRGERRHKSMIDFWRERSQLKLSKILVAAPQIDFIRDKPGVGGISKRIKHLFRFETLAEDWPAFAAQHGFSKLPHVNQSERPTTWQQEMTPELIEILNELYADDFEHLNYERIS